MKKKSLKERTHIMSIVTVLILLLVTVTTGCANNSGNAVSAEPADSTATTGGANSTSSAALYNFDKELTIRNSGETVVIPYASGKFIDSVSSLCLKEDKNFVIDVDSYLQKVEVENDAKSVPPTVKDGTRTVTKEKIGSFDVTRVETAFNKGAESAKNMGQYIMTYYVSYDKKIGNCAGAYVNVRASSKEEFAKYEAEIKSMISLIASASDTSTKSAVGNTATTSAAAGTTTKSAAGATTTGAAASAK